MKEAPARMMHQTVEREAAWSLLQLADFAPSETTALPKKMLVGVQSSASLKESPSNVNQLSNETVACKTPMATSVQSAMSHPKNNSENTAQTARVFSTGNIHAIGGIFASPQIVVSRQSRNSDLACGYCYMKMDNQSQIQEHSASSHPFLVLKSIRECLKIKRSHESSSDAVPNRIKYNSETYASSHCGGEFTSVDAVTAHSKKAHSRSEMEYKKRNHLAIGAESSDGKFYNCDFCKFTAEKHLLDKHLETNHKMRVTCSHCNKSFEFASNLKDLPMKYSQETINLTTTSGDSSIENNKNEDKNKNAVIPEKLSHYGKKPDPIDLNSLTVNIKLNGGESADLPLVYLTECFNMFPKVILKDVKKKKLN